MYACIGKACSLFCFLICFNYGYTQIIDARKTDGGNRYFITGKVQVLKTTKQLPLDRVLANYQAEFQPLKDKEVIFEGYNSFNYWFKFTVHNSDTQPKDLILVLGPLGVKDAELFTRRDEKWESLGKTGVQYPFIQRAYQYAHYAFPLRIAESSVNDFYLHMDFGHELRSYAFVLMDSKAFKKHENKVYFLFGIIIGLLSLFLALNLYLYFSIREPIHFWYSMYILALILLVMVNDELSSQFFHLDSESRYKLIPLSAVAALAIGLLLHVVQLFLSNINKRSLLYRASLFIKYNLLLSGAAHFLASNLAPGIPTEAVIFTWVNYSTIVCVVAIFVNCFYSIYKGLRTAWFIVIGIGMFLIGGIERLLLLSTPDYVFPPSIFHIGIIVETTMVSFVLIYRHRLERKETMRHMREREQLKMHQEKQLLESKIEAQEKTFKEISQEIHDNIGQLLTLAKMNLATINTLSSADSKHKIAESETFLSLALQDLGSLSSTLPSDSAARLSLVESIKAELDSLKKTAVYDIELSLEETPVNIDRRIELTLLRTFQEILNNIIKHADATEIKVALHVSPERITLNVSDNGRGFLIPQSEGASSKHGLGLRNIENRIRQIGGDLTIKSEPGRGTTVAITVELYHG